MKIFSANLRGVTTASIVNVTEEITAGEVSITSLPSITGSLTIQGSGSIEPYFFLIQSESKDLFSITTEGVIISITQSVTPTVTQAGMYFDNIGNFYVGL
jgi:hypothetical protein